MYRSSDSKSHIVVLLGLDLACRTREPKPFLLLSLSPLVSERPPEACPTAVHKPRIFLVYAVHSLKRCFLLCLPLSHHQQMSLSAHAHLSLRNGAIMACPGRSWKYLAATRFGAQRSCSLMPGLEFAVGSLKPRLSAFLFTMSSLHALVARSLAARLRKARLCCRVPVLGGFLAAASFARWSAYSFPLNPDGLGPT